MSHGDIDQVLLTRADGERRTTDLELGVPDQDAKPLPWVQRLDVDIDRALDELDHLVRRRRDGDIARAGMRMHSTPRRWR